jgi:NADH-quinone oxidoreductase subunit H
MCATVLELIIFILMVLIFPGILFLMFYSFYLEWVDRKFYADQQHRLGPIHTGWRGILQPFADFVKLMAKEDVRPAAADKIGFTLTPIIALTIPFLTLMLVPIIGATGILFFEGDLLIIGFMSTIFSMTLFLAGWASSNRFGFTGAVRGVIQMLAYEIPLLLSLFAAGIVAGSLSLSGVVIYQMNLGIPLIFCLPFMGLFVVFLVAVQAEAERLPFDTPIAETEIVAGWETEYSGKKFAFFRLANNLEVLLGAGLATAIFLGGPLGPEMLLLIFSPLKDYAAVIGATPLAFLTVPLGLANLLFNIPMVLYYTFWFIMKTMIIVLLLSFFRGLLARWRIDQIVRTSWKWVIPFSLLMVVLVALWPQILTLVWTLFGWI